MKEYPFYKKITAFGFALFLFSFSLFIFLNTESTDFFDLQGEQGVLTLIFITSIVLMLVGLILSKIKNK
jgi:hypothetical protein